MKTEWIRVSEDNRCPICLKPDWCSISSDGKIVICPRTPSNREIGEAGYLHILDKTAKVKIPKKKRYYPINWEALNHFYVNKLGDKDTHWVTRALEYGTDGESLTCPMRDANMNIIGIQRCIVKGKKKYCFVKGSKNGLFISTTFDSFNSVLVVCEGLSDTREALMMDYNAIGRASCKTGGDLICELVRIHNIKKVVIIADNDKVGIDGANKLCLKLAENNVKVNVIIPPENDLRDSIQKYGYKKIKNLLDKYTKI
jgi:hypothetical protein